MAARIGSLFVSLVADMSQFRTDMQRSAQITAETSRRMGQSVGNTDRSVRRLQGTMNRGFDARGIAMAGRSFDTVNSRIGILRGTVLGAITAFAGLGAAMGAGYVTRLADEYTNLQNQIRVVSKDSVDLAVRTNAVAAAANRSRTSLSATATLYSRLQKASPGDSAEKTLRYAETISKALALGGATAQEASSAAIQFSQAIASNRLGGEELRAIMETPLGLELARGLGVTIGKFREMGHAGELTANVVLGALSKIGSKIDEQFSNSVATVDQSLNVFQNNLTTYIGEADKAYGVTKGLGAGIMALGNNLNSIMPALAITAGLLGSMVLGRNLQRLGPMAAAPFRAASADRRDALAAARERAAAANVARTEAYARTRAAAGALRGDQRGAADRNSVRAYNNELRATQKLDAQRLALLDKQRAAMARLGAVQQQVTPAAVRAAGNLAQAETRVNNAMAAQRDLRRTLGQQNSRLTGLLARQAQLGVRSPQTREVAKQITQTQRQVEATQRQALAAQARITSESAKLEQARALAHQKASGQVIAALQAEQAVKQQLAANDAARAAQQAALRRAGVGVQASGGLANLQRLQAERAALAGVNQAARESAAGLARASAAARGMNIALAGITRVGSSFVNFIGGPWGLALAGLIGSMLYLGARAREAEQRLERMKDELADLGYISEAAAGRVDEVTKSIDEMTSDERRRKLEELNRTIADLNKRSMGGIFGGSVNTAGDADVELRAIEMRAGGGRRSERAERQRRAAAATELRELIALANEGGASAERITEKLDEIADADLEEPFDDILAALRQTLPIMDGLVSRSEDLARTMGISTERLREMQNAGLRRTAEDASMGAWLTADKTAQSFLSERTREMALTDREAALEEAADEIIKGVEDLGGIITRAAARAQAELELQDKLIDSNSSGAVGSYTQRVISAESGGNRFAKNKDSSATGLGQFITSTWIDLFRRHFPDRAQGMTDAAVAALRTDADISKRLIEEYAKENAAVLQRAGVAVTEASLHLSHFLGVGDAAKVYRAAAGTPLAGLVDADSIAANPTILGGGRTVDDAIAYANKRAGNTRRAAGDLTPDEQRAYDTETRHIEELEERQREAIKTSRERKEAYDEFTEAMRMGNEELAMETFLMGESEAVKERERFIREQIAHLKSNDLPLSREALDLIRREAEARFQIVTAQEAQKEALVALEEQQKLTIAQMDRIRNDAYDVLGGFLNDLREGKSASEALAGALDKVAQKLLDIGTNSLIDGLFGQQGTNSGGLLGGLMGGGKGLLGGSIIPGILHGGGVVGTDGMGGSRRVSAGAFHGAPRFHSGLTSREFATVLEKGEHVLTARQTAATASTIDGLSKAAANSNQRQAVDVRLSLDKNGNFQAFVDGRATVISRSNDAQMQQQAVRTFPALTADKNRRGIA